jgi:hypothetical protein
MQPEWMSRIAPAVFTTWAMGGLNVEPTRSVKRIVAVAGVRLVGRAIALALADAGRLGGHRLEVSTASACSGARKSHGGKIAVVPVASATR